MKPDFLVVGAQKCATSTLCELLAMQPGVFMCTPKEPHFFSRDEIWARGLAWYESLFAGATAGQRIGEGSTTYTMLGRYPSAASRIAAVLPGVRVIYIVRHPLRRMESHWLHKRVPSAGVPEERRPFAEVVREAPELVDNTLYWRQVDVYRRLLGPERVLVVFHEDLVRDRRAVLLACLRFIGLDGETVVLPEAEVRNNASGNKRPDNPLGLLLRKVPGFRQLRALAPAWLLRWVRRFTKGNVDERPQWDAALRTWVLARIATDNRRFLREYGKPDDFWGIDWDEGA